MYYYGGCNSRRLGNMRTGHPKLHTQEKATFRGKLHLSSLEGGHQACTYIPGRRAGARERVWEHPWELGGGCILGCSLLGRKVQRDEVRSAAKNESTALQDVK